MTHEEKYNHLLENAKTVFNDLSSYIKGRESKGYYQTLPTGGHSENEELPFKLGSNRYLFCASIHLQSQVIYFKTYELTRDGAIYPNFVVRHIPFMDIIMLPQGDYQFVEEKEFKQNAAIGRPNITKTKMIVDFPSDYFEQLHVHIDGEAPKTE